MHAYKNALSWSVFFERLQAIGIVLFFIGMPLGTTIQGIGAGLIAFTALADEQHRALLRSFAHSSWMKAIAIFLLLCLCSVIWTQGSYADWMYGLKKYLKLLFLPLLAAVMYAPRCRQIAWSAFAIGMSLIILLLVANSLHVLHIGSDLQGAVFRNYIMNGHMLAFMAFAALWYAHHAESSAQGFAAFFMAMACVLSLVCLNQGRTGYVALLLMIGLYTFWVMPNRLRFAGMALSVFAAVCLVTFVPKIHQGLYSAYQHVRDFGHGSSNTSEGFRLQFQRYATLLWLKHPLLGNGLGSFYTLFAQDNPVPAWKHGLREPHSQYFLILAELGVVGLVSVFSIFLTLLRALFADSRTRWLALALLTLFAAGNLSDSLLFYSGSGYFFLGFLGLLLGECYASGKAKLSISRTSST